MTKRDEFKITKEWRQKLLLINGGSLCKQAQTIVLFYPMRFKTIILILLYEFLLTFVRNYNYTDDDFFKLVYF